MKLRAAIPALALLSAVGLTACATPIPGPPQPPPTLVETVPLPPVSETPLIWQPGHYDWSGAAYVWQPGRYVPRNGHSLWQPGAWTGANGSYTWVPAHWAP